MSTEDKEKSKLENLRIRDIFTFTWNYWKQYPLYIFPASGLMIIATMCDIFIPVFSGRLVDALALGFAAATEAEKDVQIRAAYWALGGFAGLAAMHHILRITGVRLWVKMTTQILKRITDDALYKVSRFSTDWHANSFAGATVRKITRGKWAFDLLGDTLYMGLIPAVMVLIGITLIQTIHWPMMGLVFTIGFAIYMTASVILSTQYVAPANREFNTSDSAVGAELADSITCNPVVKAFGSEDREDERVQKSTGRWGGLALKAWMRHVNTDMVQSSLLICMLIVVVGLAIWRWAIGLATPGEVSFCMSSYFIVNGYIRNIGMQIRHLQKGINEMEDVVEFSLQDLGVADAENAVSLKVEKGGISFDDVTFTYDNKDKPTYKNFSVRIKPGEKVGLVGHSGSGKSTFVKLIQRLYDVNDGEVSIDGQNIAGVTQASLRQAIAMVPQDPILFHRSLAENIAYGKPDAGMDEIIHAARLAKAHDFIGELPEGYDTLVGERGIKLSGGERQRVAIARAILADKPILILDEATSSLDSVSEALIQEAIENLTEGRTTIMIAHRLSTIQSVDRILVFHNGRIVEQGTHAELVKVPNGHYRELFEMQTFGLIGKGQTGETAEKMAAE